MPDKYPEPHVYPGSQDEVAAQDSINWNAWIDLHYGEEPQPAPQERHTSEPGSPQSEGGSHQHRRPAPKKQHRRGKRVFSDAQLDIIQDMVEEDTGVKPASVMQELRRQDPTMRRSLKQVRGSVKDARRQKKKKAAEANGTYDASHCIQQN